MLNADEHTVSVRRKGGVTNEGDHCPIAFVYRTFKCMHDTKMSAWHTCKQPHTHAHTPWIVLINISLFVSKDLMREKLAQGTDCLSHRVSVFKCPLLLLFMRQCSLYVADWQEYSPPLCTAAKDNALQSHIIYLTSSHYSSLQFNIM